MCIPILITPFVWYACFKIVKRLVRNKGRYIPPDSNGNWIRVVRSAKARNKGIVLSQGQRNEERIGSREYEIWKNKTNGKICTLPWVVTSKYKKCPRCGFYTLATSVRLTIREATYSSSGRGEELDKCRNCSYKLHKRFFSIAKKVVSSSRSSGSGSSRSSGGSSSSSSSGGSSSSSGGSFGGGSSGGGGAGGSW